MLFGSSRIRGLDRLPNPLADRYPSLWWLILGALFLPLGCGDPAAPVYAPLAITTTVLPNAAPTVAYTATLVATGGDSSYTWSLTDGALPAGLSLADATGAIVGTPAGSSSRFTVRVVSGDGQTASQDLLIYVYDTLAVTTTSLPSGSTGGAYSEALVAAGGDGIYTWSVTDGSLPPGLRLADTTGVISGTPTEEGGDTFTVQVASGDGQTASQQLTIDVALVLQPSERCSDYPDYAIATFEDTALEAEIREALLLGQQEPLTCAVLTQRKGLLPAHDAGITSLVGIQNLTGLTGLWISHNSISDISAPSSLTSLTYLDLSYNSISDISALSGLTHLEVLYAKYNSITDIGALSGHTNLGQLNLEHNLITDISALSGLTNLGEELNLGHNSLSDISALSGLTTLIYLYLDNNSITDISALSGLTNLDGLWINDNLITDVTPLSELPSLWWLVLSDNSISDISPLSGLNLGGLHLSSNSISDVSPLSGLSNLSTLYLMDNSISDIGPLGGLTNLSELMLRSNLISDISALSGLTNLRVLYLDNNSISVISALRGLTSLRELPLNDNPALTDIQPLLDNPGLGAGDAVNLKRTSASCADVTALGAKGVTVESDCP